MDFGALYDFLFNTYAGIGCLVGIGLVVSFDRVRHHGAPHAQKRSSITSLTRTIGPFSMTTKTTSNVFAFVPNGDQTMRIAF
mgnify:CR=1 FL=1